MARRPTNSASLAPSSKEFLHRLSVGLLVLSAVALMLLGKADAVIVERLRLTVSDVFSPVLSGLSRPVQSVSSAVQDAGSYFSLHMDNARLREENARLRDWFAVARQLEAENTNLRSLLNTPQVTAYEGVAARVIADSAGEFARSALLEAGASHGVQRGQAVINDEGLVGRITEAGRRSARVLFITDLNSRVPVLNERTRERAILIGDNSALANLRYISEEADVVAGDRIVTSGDGGVFPAGLDVGDVVVGASGDVGVRPYVRWSRLEFVRVLGLQPRGIVTLEAPAPVSGGAAQPAAGTDASTTATVGADPADRGTDP
ncbi:MAG: rod shape-determining protein MreC [Alphaproteobacteria bacterium]